MKARLSWAQPWSLGSQRKKTVEERKRWKEDEEEEEKEEEGKEDGWWVGEFPKAMSKFWQKYSPFLVSIHMTSQPVKFASYWIWMNLKIQNKTHLKQTPQSSSIFPAAVKYVSVLDCKRDWKASLGLTDQSPNHVDTRIYIQAHTHRHQETNTHMHTLRNTHPEAQQQCLEKTQVHWVALWFCHRDPALFFFFLLLIPTVLTLSSKSKEKDLDQPADMLWALKKPGKEEIKSIQQSWCGS